MREIARIPVVRCRGWPFLFLFGFSFSSLSAQPEMPMPVTQTNSAYHRWLQKPVREARLLDDMESTNHWSHHGHGRMTFTIERAKQGQTSIRLIAPTKTAEPPPVAGRPFGEAGVRRNFRGEDWTQFNRLSFHVFPTLPGFAVASMLVKLHNDGEKKVPDRYGREGLNYALLQPNEWNQVVWEIAHLPRDKVTGVEFIYRLQGNEPGATNVVAYDLDLLELQRVEADHFEGWNVAPGRIAYSHTGYQVGASKTALSQNLPAKEFKVLTVSNETQTVLTRPLQQTNTVLGQFQVLDFTEIRQPGRYALKVGDLITEPFEIRENAWEDTIWKTLNFYYSQRCGTAIGGIHAVCHQDWTASHKEKTIVINGGWHDAGDLSQGLVNTAESASAMFSLGEKLRTTDPALAERLIEEAKWGLGWILKTHFGDGYRVTWATMDFWTDGQRGNADDVQGQVRNSSFENFLAAATEALASRVLKTNDAGLARRSLETARADWRFANHTADQNRLETAGAGALAAIELFQATGEQDFANRAYEFADIILECQHRSLPDAEMPLTGFFYTTTNRTRILHYSHRSHEQAPVAALASLCRLFPKHTDWMRWYSGVLLYSEYLRGISKFTAPYGVLPASIYSLDESNDARFREQVAEGLKLTDRYYLRRFPVWFDVRGNYGVLLSQTKALSAAAQLRNALSLADLAQLQLQWVLGRNPFAQSTMFGEGRDFPPLYTAMSGDIVGALPVGIQTREGFDWPYWPAANCYNYKEVWIHPAARWLSIMEDVAGPATVTGTSATVAEKGPIEFHEIVTGIRYIVRPEKTNATFMARLPAGEYRVEQAGTERNITILPAARYRLDLVQSLDFSVSTEAKPGGQLTIRVKANGVGPHRFQLRAHNLTIAAAERFTELRSLKPETLSWEARTLSPAEPWFAVIIPDDNVSQLKEAPMVAPAEIDLPGGKEKP